MASNISSGLGVGLARPTSPQRTAGMDIAGAAAKSASSIAQKGQKAAAIKSVKVKVKMAKPKG